MKYEVRFAGKECGGRKEFDCVNSLIVFLTDEVKKLPQSEYNKISIKIID